MKRLLPHVLCGLLLSGLALWGSLVVRAQDDPTKDRTNVSLDQQRVQIRFKELQDKLLKLAEITEATDPTRAALLRKAFEQGSKQQIEQRLADLVKLIGNDQLGKAVEEQTVVKTELNKLLELLMSEQGPKRLADEKERIKKYLEAVKRLIKDQTEVEENIRNGANEGRTADRQGKVADRTETLGKEIAKNEGLKPNEGNSKSNDGNGKSADGNSKSSDGNKSKSGGEGSKSGGEGSKSKSGGEGSKSGGEGSKSKSGGEGSKSGGEGSKSKSGGEGSKSGGEGSKSKSGGEGSKSGGEGSKSKSGGEGSKSGGEGSKSKSGGEGSKSGGEGSKSKSGGEGSKSEGSKSGKSKGGSGGQSDPRKEPEEGQAGDSDGNPKPQDKLESTKKRIYEAEKRMREAKQKLEKAQREGALKEAEAANNKLKEIEKELEELLRQLREEEMERLLAFLEARFKKMLEMEIAVYEGTLRLDRTPQSQRAAPFTTQAARLGRDQSLIEIEAEKALNLLREDGTSVAMTESVTEMIGDMKQVVVYLSQGKTAMLPTQQVEEDIIAALEEMIEALKKAQRDLKDPQKQPPGQPGQPQDPSLIDMLAEVKMLKSLQLRVNRRTETYRRQLDHPDDDIGTAKRQDLVKGLDDLKEREERIFRAARDLVTGRNK